MRKRRAVLCGEEPIIIDALKMFFEGLEYEVMAFQEPVVCPVYYGPHDCKRLYPCADIILMDYRMPRINGLTLLQEQAHRGCKLTPQNKALLTGSLEKDKLREVERLGVALFQKPMDFEALATWVRGCEERMDLSLPLGIRRREPRSDCRKEVTYQAPTYYAPASGLAVNTSSSGICLHLSAPLAREQKVRLHSDLFGIAQTASVRWIREIDKGQYMAGLQYDQ